MQTKTTKDIQCIKNLQPLWNCLNDNPERTGCIDIKRTTCKRVVAIVTHHLPISDVPTIELSTFADYLFDKMLMDFPMSFTCDWVDSSDKWKCEFDGKLFAERTRSELILQLAIYLSECHQASSSKVFEISHTIPRVGHNLLSTNRRPTLSTLPPKGN